MSKKAKPKKGGNYRGGRKTQLPIPEGLKPYLTRLKVFRQRCGGKQDNVAEAVGISRTYLIKIESGKAAPSMAVLFRLLREFKTTLEEFFQGSSFSPTDLNVHLKIEEIIRSGPKASEHLVRDIELQYDAAVAAKKEISDGESFSLSQ